MLFTNVADGTWGRALEVVFISVWAKQGEPVAIIIKRINTITIRGFFIIFLLNFPGFEFLFRVLISKIFLTILMGNL